MANIICPFCKTSNDDRLPYCAACGQALFSDSERLVTGNYSTGTPVSARVAEVVPEVEKPATPTVEDPIKDTAATLKSANPEAVFVKARLIPKSKTFPVAEILLERRVMSLGQFDPDFSPVDIDLEDLLGAEKAKNISRQHAEIYFENGVWNVKDLGSTNGVFIRRVNESRFSARLIAPEVLRSGDEVAFANIQFVFETLN